MVPVPCRSSRPTHRRYQAAEESRSWKVQAVQTDVAAAAVVVVLPAAASGAAVVVAAVELVARQLDSPAVSFVQVLVQVLVED